MTKIEETYPVVDKNANKVIQSPTAYPDAGIYDAPHMITLLCGTEGAVIHYTMDGTMPTADGPVFDPYLLVPLEQFGHDVPQDKRSYTIRAVAVVGNQLSDVVDFRYDIIPRSRNEFISESVFPGISMIRDFQNNKMYLITGTQGALLIDAGMSTADLRNYVKERIGDLPLDVFITHGHPDHIAAMGQFQGDYDVYMHHADLPLTQ